MFQLPIGWVFLKDTLLALTFLGFSEHYTFLTSPIQLLMLFPNEIHFYAW